MLLSEKIGVLEAALAHGDVDPLPRVKTREVGRPVLPSYRHMRGVYPPRDKQERFKPALPVYLRPFEEAQSMDAPSTSTGALHAVLLGLAAAVTALLVAQFFPTIIPARAAAVKL